MSNFDKFAKVYDFLYHGTKWDIEFYKSLAKKENGKILEVACGTGRIYFELLKLGVDAYGIDISKKMLQELRNKAKEEKLEPKVYKADMKTFRFNHKFSLIIIPFRSFLHNLTTEEQIKALKNFKRHLEPGGKLALNFFNPDPWVIVKNYNKTTTEKIDKTYTLENFSKFIDEPNRIVKVTHKLLKNNKTVWKSELKLALINKKEFELLLRQAGFSKWKVKNGQGKIPKSSSDELYWVVEK